MRLTASLRYAIGVPLIAAGVFATAGARTSTIQPPFGRACTAVIADAVPIGSNPANVAVRFSEALGDSLSASIADGSGVIVVSVTRRTNDGPMSAVLELNTMRASAGVWDVTVRSERGECIGKARVGDGAATKAPAKTLSAKAPASKAGHRECAAFMNDSIPMGLDRTEVTANYSEPIGNTLSARLPKESGVDVLSAKRNPGDDPLSAVLVLNTTRAVSGQWRLELTGDGNVCTGMVYVGKKR